MGDVELVGLYWTVSGPVEVHVGREWSLFDFARPLRAGGQRSASRGSASGTPTSSTCSRRARSREMKAILDDHGLTHLELEFLMRLVPRSRRRAPRRVRPARARCCSRPPPCSAPTTSRSATSPARRASSSRLTERFAELCADAAEHHATRRSPTSSCRSTSNVHTLDDALAVVGGAGAPNGGLAIDTWHMAQARDRARGAAARSRSSTSPGSSSATGSSRGHGRPDRRDRQPPRACPARASSTSAATSTSAADIGYPGPWGVEVLSEELRNLPIERDLRPGVRDDAAPSSAPAPATERSAQ